MIPVFYSPPQNIIGEILTISGDEAHHLAKVMRLKKGDAVDIVDGEGKAYHCTIDRIDKEKAICKIYRTTAALGEPSHHITLAAGLSTGTKIDDVIERCTELGISRFIPLITEKSKIKIGRGSDRKGKFDRWRKVAVASMKQTRRSLIPVIEPINEFGTLFEKFNDLGSILIFDPDSDSINLNEFVPDVAQNKYTILVGPESGFSRDEIEKAVANGAIIVSLGRRILRTENAGPTALALLMHILGEFR